MRGARRRTPIARRPSALVALAAGEARRIEAKFSRYRRGNVIDAINTAEGRTVIVDEETARLLDYAEQLLRAQRRQVRRDVGRAAPRVAIRRQRPRADAARPSPRCCRSSVGTRCAGERPSSRSRPAWRSISAASARSTPSTARRRWCASLSTHCLFNFGGDLLALGPQADGQPWRVGIESVSDTRPRRTPHRATDRRARDERRRAPLPVQGRRALRPRSRSDDRLARGRARRARSRLPRTPARRPGCWRPSRCCRGATRKRFSRRRACSIGHCADARGAIPSCRSPSARRSCRRRCGTCRTTSSYRSAPRVRDRATRGERPARRGRLPRRCERDRRSSL